MKGLYYYMQDCKVNILGTEWSIKFGNEQDYPALKDNDGYTDSSVREIIVDNFARTEKDPERKKNIEEYGKRVIRHELIHAFLTESGLDGNGHYADHWEFNEEMVDWIAIQSPKIFKVFTELDLL